MHPRCTSIGVTPSAKNETSESQKDNEEYRYDLWLVEKKGRKARESLGETLPTYLPDGTGQY